MAVYLHNHLKMNVISKIYLVVKLKKLLNQNVCQYPIDLILFKLAGTTWWPMRALLEAQLLRVRRHSMVQKLQYLKIDL